jgi:hypothetical protein
MLPLRVWACVLLARPKEVILWPSARVPVGRVAGPLAAQSLRRHGFREHLPCRHSEMFAAAFASNQVKRASRRKISLQFRWLSLIMCSRSMGMGSGRLVCVPQGGAAQRRLTSGEWGTASKAEIATRRQAVGKSFSQGGYQTAYFEVQQRRFGCQPEPLRNEREGQSYACVFCFFTPSRRDPRR